MTKREYFEHFGLPWPPTPPKLLTLDQGKFQMERRLKQLDLVLSGETEKEGSCMFDAILDQIQYIPELKYFAHSHWELRWKIVSEGYDKFLMTGM